MLRMVSRLACSPFNLVFIIEMVLSFCFLSATNFCPTLGTSLPWILVFLSCICFIRFLKTHIGMLVYYFQLLCGNIFLGYLTKETLMFCCFCILLVRASLYKCCTILFYSHLKHLNFPRLEYQQENEGTLSRFPISVLRGYNAYL